MGFEVLMNGVGNAFSRRRWGTNFLVRKEGFVLAVDCPDSYRRALMENDFEHAGDQLDVGDIDGLLITHLHGDHVNGLEMVLAYRRYIIEENLELYAPPPVAADLWDRKIGVSLGQTWDGDRHVQLGPDDYYALNELSWEGTAEIGPFDIDLRETVHHLPTAALRISDGEATLGYSCDTEFDERLIEWLSGSDTIFHETSYGPGHTPLFELRNLSPSLRSKMKVVHLPDDALELEGEVELEFAQEGAVYRVGED